MKPLAVSNVVPRHPLNFKGGFMIMANANLARSRIRYAAVLCAAFE